MADHEVWYNGIKENIKEAFKELRKEGFECHMNFQCCSNCGVHALKKETTKFVFWHQQDTEDAERAGGFYMTWGATVEDGVRIMQAFMDHGVPVGWDGRPETRLYVYGPAGFVNNTSELVNVG